MLFSPSDLNAFLECEHLTQLELAVATASSSSRLTRTLRPSSSSGRATSTRRPTSRRSIAEGREVVTIAHDWDSRRAAHGRPRRRLRPAPTSSTRRASSTAAGAGSPTSSSGRPDGSLRGASTRSSRGTRSRPTSSSSASTPSRSRGSRGRCRSGCTSCSGTASGRASASRDFVAYYRRVRERFVQSPSSRADRRLPAAGLALRALRLQAALRRAVGRGRPPQPRRRHAAATRSAARGAPGSRRSPRSRARPTRPGRPRWRRARSRRSATRRDCSSPRARDRRTRCELLEPRAGARLRAAARRRRPATSSSTSRATRSGTTGRGLEYLWGDRSTRPARFDAALGARPRERAARVRGVRRPRPRAARRRPGHARLPLRGLRGHRAPAADGRATARARTRSTTCSAARSSSTSTRSSRRGCASRVARYGLKEIETFLDFERDAELQGRRRLDRRCTSDYARDARPADPRRRSRPTTRRTASATLAAARLAARRGRARRRSPSALEPREPRRRARRRPRSSAPRCSQGCPTTAHDARSSRPAAVARGAAARLPPTARRKPVWWAFFDRIGRTPEELQRATTPTRSAGSSRRARRSSSGESLVYPLHASRAQEHKLGPGDQRRSTRDRRAGRRRSSRSTSEAGRSRCGAARRSTTQPLPRALIPGGPYDTDARAAGRRSAARRARCSPATGAIRALEVGARAATPFAAPRPAGRPRRGEAARRSGSTAATSSSRGRPAPARPGRRRAADRRT